MHKMLERVLTTSIMIGGVLLWPAASLAQTSYMVTGADTIVLQNQEALAHVWHDKSRGDRALDIFSAIDVNTTPDIIWNIMTDCARGNEIVKGMLSCDILETNPAQSSDIRQQVFDMGPFLPNVKTQFESVYDKNKSITIRRVGGDLKIQEAMWTFEPLETEQTRVSYRATIAFKLPVPRTILKNATRKDTPQIMRNLKRVAEADQEKKFKIVEAPVISPSRASLSSTLSSLDEMP